MCARDGPAGPRGSRGRRRQARPRNYRTAGARPRSERALKQTSNAPARLADGLEVEGPPPVDPDVPLADRWSAHWFPRSAPRLGAADSAFLSIRPRTGGVKERTISP